MTDAFRAKLIEETHWLITERQSHPNSGAPACGLESPWGIQIERRTFPCSLSPDVMRMAISVVDHWDTSEERDPVDLLLRLNSVLRP